MNSYTIKAVTVNHNTSQYCELMLRYLFVHHPYEQNVFLTVFDNSSTDDTSSLKAYAESKGVPIRQSGFTAKTQNNSHGEILRRFVLEQPDCTYYLFLDTDVCFLEDNTLRVMRHELETATNAFGIGTRISWARPSVEYWNKYLR